MKKNSMILSETIDNVNHNINHHDLGQIYGSLQIQALIITLKEIYGWLLLTGLFCLLLFLIKKSSMTSSIARHAKYRIIRRSVKHDLKN